MKSFRVLCAVAVITAMVSWLEGCGGATDTPSTVRRMGEAVPVGALLYTVLDVEWKDDLGGGSSSFPTHRLAIVRLNINNAGSHEVSAPLLQLENAKGKSYPELTEVNGIGDWLGLLRTINPGESQQGRIVFDVPPGEYRLRLSSSGDPSKNETALVEIPIRIPEVSEIPAPALPAAQQ